MPKKDPAKSKTRKTSPRPKPTTVIPPPTPPTEVAQAGDEHLITIRGAEGPPQVVRNIELLKEIGRYWTYVVGNRTRFTSESRNDLQSRATGDLARLGISLVGLETVARSGAV